MKYLPSILSVVIGVPVVGFVAWFTREPQSLWALLIVAIMAVRTYPKSSEQ